MARKETVNTSDLEATIVFDEDSASTVDASGEDSVKTAPQCRELTFDKRFVFVCDYAKGGIGKIAKAQDISFDRIVAVKTLNAEHAAKETSVAAFARECRLNARLDHPAIVPIYAQGCDGEGHPGVAMKLINGIPLHKFIGDLRQQYDRKKVKPFQERHALISRLEYFLKACEVMEYCHSLKIVHGDLKPQNLLLGRFGELYLIDWGCARNFGEKPEKLVGTPNYMPPEYMKTHEATPQVDIYALGMILFELVTLRYGCNGYTNRKEKEKIQNSTTRCPVENVASYRHYLPDVPIPAALKAIVMKAVEPLPARRYKSVAALANDVRHFIYGEEISACPDNFFQKLGRIMSRNRGKTVAFASVILLAFIGAWGYTAYRSAEEQHEQAEAMLRRMRLQSYTDLLSVAVGNRILGTQCQLLLFADNILEDMREPLGTDANFCDNVSYARPETSPEGMERCSFYATPVNFRHMVRLNRPTSGKILPRLSEAQFVTLCRKIVNYDLSDGSVNANRTAKHAIAESNNPIQRLQVLWRDGIWYSYPGILEDTSTPQYRARYGNTNSDRGTRILWYPPFRTRTDRHSIICRYPMTEPDGRYLGEARLELRLEVLLAPVLKANLADPVHELFFITEERDVLMARGGRLHLLNKTDPEAVWAVKRLIELQNNHMQQFEAVHNGKKHYVSGTYIQPTRCVLLQMIEEGAMRNHRHVDLSL